MAVENLKTLRRRIRSIKNTKQITHAMEMVSAAKLRRIQNALLAGRPFIAKLQEILSNLSASEQSKTHQCFKTKTHGNILVVLITADRGLCGAYNNNLIHVALDFIKSYEGQKISAFCIGKKGLDFFKKHNIEILGHNIELSGRLIYDKIQEISKQILDLFFNKEIKEVYLIYNRFISTMSYKPTVELFLPLNSDFTDTQKHNDKKFNLEFILEPDPQTVFELIVPRYLQSKFYMTLAESFTSEHSARMVSMNNATKNCEELINTYTLKMNKARQASITRELIDIVGGSNAIVQK